MYNPICFRIQGKQIFDTYFHSFVELCQCFLKNDGLKDKNNFKKLY